MITSKKIAKNIDYGYITMSKDGDWTWWPTKPSLDKEDHWYTNTMGASKDTTKLKFPCSLKPIKIRPAKNWRKSLIKCGGGK